ncbi:pyridoxal phosphate-dependent aminotransferase [Gordonia polyisoprenivorans]|uniref:pyridoxal phosphate-dependent aminotransferase n=1 Tax=Gordonia polyisoprenivorans TaxID=84595 RepID=UPI001AD73550|nr:aminotransferase class I/II-fold pyridoxal phosphate-dependent enzyme [Gordonia polyisoprenivorans]QTI68925.1 aminotransferase class I/II-fold pyridoxal phosphate-dependent enzyme [Gordonia polyisoprenivorans]
MTRHLHSAPDPPPRISSQRPVALQRIPLDLNESAYGPLPSLARALTDAVPSLNRYPEFLPDRTRRTIAGHLGVDDDAVTVGPGATGVLAAALHCAVRHGARRGVSVPELLTPVPTFGGYPILTRSLGLRFRGLPLDVRGRPDLQKLYERVGTDTVAVAVCSPHNPTGAVLDSTELFGFCAALPDDVTVIIDQAYLEFADTAPDLESMLATHRRVVAVRTFSKAHGLAGLRVGYGVGQIPLIDELRSHEVPFAVGSLAELAVPLTLDCSDELSERVRRMRIERRYLADRLRAAGAHPWPSHANFLFLPGAEGIALGDVLIACGISVTPYRPHGLRITVGDRHDTERVIRTLKTVAASA